MDAVLSLKVASSTVGAHELADLAARLERLLRRGDLSQAVVVETSLAAAAARADHALGAYLGG
jgi:HPt (histidine-containing phosphotransfer) domain-containing protein